MDDGHVKSAAMRVKPHVTNVPAYTCQTTLATEGRWICYLRTNVKKDGKRERERERSCLYFILWALTWTAAVPRAFNGRTWERDSIPIS